jgi:hypothetical protein
MLRIASYECKKYWRAEYRNGKVISLNTIVEDEDGYETEMIKTIPDEKGIAPDTWFDAKSYYLKSPKRVHGKRPRIVRDNGSQFVAKEWREVMRHFEMEEIPIRARHPESNRRIERYHRSVREEAFGDTEVEDLYRARELLAEWMRYYNEERLHSALEYLRPVDYYRGNPQALLAERKTKLREAAARRSEEPER